MNTIKFLFPLAGLATGIFLVSEFTSALVIAPVALGISLTLWLILTILSRNPRRGIFLSKYHFLWIFFLFLAIGAYDFHFRCKTETGCEMHQKEVELSGKISAVTESAEGDRYVVNVESIHDANGSIFCKNVKLLLITDGFMAHKGDVINFRAKTYALSQGHSQEYAERMRHKGILYTAKVSSSEIIRTGKENSISGYFHDFRNNLIIDLEKSSLQRNTATFLISLLLGDKLMLPSHTRETLNHAGLTHILALSGMHVGIVFGILMTILFPLNLLQRRKVRWLLALMFLWMYVLLSGGAPATVRAAWMATILTGGLIMERKTNPLNTLLAAVFFIVLVDPFSLWDIGFQLSFLCVACILLFTSPLNPVNRHSHPRVYRVVNAFLITLITTIGTWTLVAYYFKSVPLLFLPANIILLPLLPFFIGVGMMYLLFLTFGIDIHFLAVLLDKFTDVFVGSAGFLSINGASVVKVNLSFWLMILWVVALGIAAMAIHANKIKYKRIGGIVASLCVAIFIFGMFIPEKKRPMSLRFKHSLTKIEARLYHEDGYTDMDFPRGNIAKGNIGDVEILSIDTPVHQDSLKIWQKGVSPLRYLIIGPGADHNQLADLIEGADFSKVILHSGIGEQKKTELLRLININNHKKIYSLRSQGSLEFEL